MLSEDHYQTSVNPPIVLTHPEWVVSAMLKFVLIPTVAVNQM